MFGLQVATETPVLGLQAPDPTSAQIFVCPRGFETPQPDFGIDVGDPDAVDQAHARVKAGVCASSTPSPTNRGGVRRFFLEDPDGRIINVLAQLPNAT